MIERTEYMTEEDAATELALKLLEHRQFCPLIRKKCNHDCVCFSVGRVWPTGLADKKVFRLTPPQCINAMFDGERSCGS